MFIFHVSLHLKHLQDLGKRQDGLQEGMISDHNRLHWRLAVWHSQRLGTQVYTFTEPDTSKDCVFYAAGPPVGQVPPRQLTYLGQLTVWIAWT